MGKYNIIIVNKKVLCLFILTMLILLLFIILYRVYLTNILTNSFNDPKSGIIVIDPGHGGIDGGTNIDGILEKEANLVISKIIKEYLVKKGYKVIMTREEDISLDKFDTSSISRQKRDLNARVNIINNSNAQFFLSIHVNCNLKRPRTDGAIVFYNKNFQQNKELAYCIQRSLNGILINGNKRTIHDPQLGEYFILNYSEIPGVIVETAFISNIEERKLLKKFEFRDQIALSVAEGVECYLNKVNGVITQEHQ